MTSIMTLDVAVRWGHDTTSHDYYLANETPISTLAVGPFRPIKHRPDPDRPVARTFTMASSSWVQPGGWIDGGAKLTNSDVSEPLRVNTAGSATV